MAKKGAKGKPKTTKLKSKGSSASPKSKNSVSKAGEGSARASLMKKSSAKAVKKGKTAAGSVKNKAGTGTRMVKSKADVIMGGHRVDSVALQKLGKLHDEKKHMLEQFSYIPGQNVIRDIQIFSEKQNNVLLEDLGLKGVDWDALAYDEKSRKVVVQEILKVKQPLEKMGDAANRSIEHILINIKMYYLHLREESQILEKKEFGRLPKNIQDQESQLLQIVAQVNKFGQGDDEEVIEKYDFMSKNIPITIKLMKKSNEYVPIYDLEISSISKQTEYFLEKIRKELIHKVNLGIVELNDAKSNEVINEKFSETIVNLLNSYFPDLDESTTGFLTTYLIQRSLGLGKVDILMDDPWLEEIAINSAKEPIWVYHRKHAWVKTNIQLESEDQIRHYATMIGRKVGRQLTVLDPLLDASLNQGDRVNATIMPISNQGNTITIRKTQSKPWTITDLIKSRTISAECASMIWLGLQYELSALIAGGTASGKTSMLNSMATLFPPNQRIISIEDTREIMLPKYLHWLPMMTRLPNAEGKGGVGMIDLLVNSLRQRPDRILVGEIRRKKEAEVLFEAIHTGHSVYATVHANSTKDAITRLTSPPIEIPKTMLPAISMMIVQYRNRRTGLRRTFQFSEISEEGEGNVVYQYDAKKDVQALMNKSKALMDTIQLFTGMNQTEITNSIKEKSEVLKWLAKNDINDVDRVGRVIAEFYTNRDNLRNMIKKNLVP